MAPTNHRLTDTEAAAALLELDGWTLRAGRLYKQYRFGTFARALAFMVEVGYAAERLDHHPNWSNVYDRVEVELWSHDLEGVSMLCVELAKAMERAAR